MPDIHITAKGVQKLLENLNPSKAAGPDQIPTRILKICAKQLAPALAQLLQQSLTEGIVPEDWRTANVASIFKKGDRSKASNYRPVSLTVIVCKLMVHILVSHIMMHLETNNILTIQIYNMVSAQNDHASRSSSSPPRTCFPQSTKASKQISQY